MLKRCTSILLAFLLVISCIPMQVFATEDTVVTEDEKIFLNEEDYPISSITDDYVDIDETESAEDIASSPGEPASAEGSVQAIGTPESRNETAGVALFSENSNAALLSETDDPAACGESLSWSYDENSKTLTISGSGAMTNYGSASAVPWYANMAVIEAVVIESGAATVGDYAFYGASALKTVSIPSGIESIGKYAFYTCSALEEVVLPDSITALGYRCFASCASLNQINIPLNWNNCPSYSSTVNADYCGHIFQDCTSLTSVIVPEGMTTLPTYAFAFCNKVVSVSLPSTLTALPSQAFYNCSALENIDIPERVTTIGKSAFCYCTSLADVDIPNGVTELALFAFYECKSLTEVQLPDSITSIGYQCFYNCTSLSSINIPRNWTDTPSSNTNGTMNADYCGHIFQECKSLKSLTIPEGLTLPSYALCYSDYLESVTLPSTITEIKNHTFYNCSRLTSVEVPTGVTYIGKSAFCYCSALTEVTLPASLTELALYAFNNCKALEEVQLPDSIISIGWQCFADCSNLTTINLPLSWTEVPSSSTNGTMNTDYCGHIFQGCKKLTTITIPDGLTVPVFGLCYSDYMETVNLPANATRIEALTFYGCSRLKNIKIPNSVTYIGKSAFNSCDALEKINIPNGITEIVSYTFDGCESLSTIDIPETVTKIGAYAFNDCKTLTSVAIPDTVTGIGYHAFANCINLTDVTLSSNWTECLSNSTNGTMGTSYCGGIFYGCTSLLTITVPEGVAALPKYAFANCNNLKSVKLPSTLTSIPAYAFYGCSALISIAVPDGVSVISERAFYNASSLMVVNIPASVISIEENAFNGCTLLKNINYTGNESDWEDVAITNSGNTEISEVKINYGFSVTYNPDDFLGIWDGEYDGQHNDLTIVQRHFVVVIEECTKDGHISGTITIAPSDKVYSPYSANGINEFAGTVDLLTGAMFFQGYKWIQVPEMVDDSLNTENYNWDFAEYRGTMSADKTELTGKSQIDLEGDFYATRVGSSAASNTVVYLLKDNRQYNILAESVSLIKDESEKVTITVVPDWKNHNPATIRLFQRTGSIESKSGVFLDIEPAAVFSPYENIYVALIDGNGNAVETRKLKLKITLPLVSRLNSSTTETALTIYENKKGSEDRNDNYVLSSAATVTVNGTKYTTNSKGIVKIPTITEGSITVEKESFITRTITAGQLDASKKIYLQKVSDGKPVVSAVWVGTTDVLNQSCTIDLLSKEETTFTVEVDWGNSSYGSIALMQAERTVLFTGTDLSTVLSDNFDVSETIYIVAKNAEGGFTKKALKIEVGDAAGTPAWLNGLSFKLGDSLSATIPDNVNPSWMGGKEIGTGISSLVPVTISVDNGKVFMAIGVDLAIYERKDSFATSTTSKNTSHALKTTTFISQFKDMRDQIKKTGIVDSRDLEKSLKKLKNFESTFRQAIKYPQGKFGFDADFSVLGFAEGYYAPDATSVADITWIDSGLIVNPRVDVSATYPVLPLVFLEGGISANVLAQFNLYIQKQAKNFTPDGELSGTLAMKLGLGAGVKGILYGSGGVKGELSPLWRFNYGAEPDYFKLTASGKWYGKFGFLFWDVPLESDPWYEEVWYEHPKTQKSMQLFALDTPIYASIYDASNYVRKDMTYLDEGSDFIGNATSTAALFSLASDSAALSNEILKTNVYRQTIPQFVQFEDGTGLAVWQDAADSGMNSLCLYYSYFDGSTWRAPTLVCDDGTVDNAPHLTKIGNTAYLVWQNATKQFTNNDTIESIAPYFDIALAVFDAETGFDTKTIACDGLDMMPTICGYDDTVYVVWSKNSVNDWFGTNGSDSICHCEYNTGVISDIVTDYEGINSVNSITADYDGKLNIVYCMDVDGDTSTYDDIRVYENGTRVTSEAVLETYPTYNNGTLYWNSQGSIVCKDDGDQEIALGVANYQIVQGNGETVLIYISSNGLASTLNVSYLNPETQQWCAPIELTDGDRFIGAFSASMSEDGTLTVLVNSQEVVGTFEDEEPYGESALTLVTLSPYCDLTVGELMYAADAYNAGTAMEFSFNLTNSGSQTVNSATITLSDDQGTVLSSIKMDDVIVPGQTITASTYFNIDAAATGQNIIITVTPNELTDANDADNSQSATLAFEDLSVEQASWGVQADGIKTLSANIVNYGYAARQNIVVELREGSIDGTVVETTTIASLDVLSLDTVTFDLVGQNSEVYFISIKDSDDVFAANDHDYVAILADETDCITIDKISEDNAQLYLENDQAGRCIVAIYNADGKMLTCGMADVTENAGEISVPYLPFTCDADYTMKVFLVNSSYAPICECVTKEY